MAQVNVSISINGWDKQLKVSALSLQQSYNRHHIFELVAPVPEGYQITRENLKSILGEQAHIKISTHEREKDHCQFIGFVDEVVPIWTAQSTTLRVKGFSPTIFMDCVPKFRCFSENTVGQILDKTLNEYSGKHRINITSKDTGDQVPFSMQAQETDYQYLCRLADNYGKMFFYDGQQLQFGNLDDLAGATVPIDFKKASNHMELSLNLAPISFKLSGYDLEKSETLLYNASQEIFNSNRLVGATLDKSSQYPTQRLHLTHLINGHPDLKQTAAKVAARQAHELVTLHGRSNHPGLKIGSKIKIEQADELIDKSTYTVIEVNHQVNSNNSYHNTFTAVPTGYPFPMRMRQARNPVCGPLMAVVKATNDPKNFGRVKVQFIGDEEKSLSPWIRVLTPYTKYGGLFFLPEKEDQVVVFYEDFNAEKSSFVLGSFYHGKATAEKWQDGDNKKKGIALDKIHLLFDDHTGKLVIEAEEIEFKARKEMKINGGQQLTQKATRIDLNP